MSGLYEKAMVYLQNNPAPAESSTELVFEEEAGVSKEEQREILQEIEKEARQNKLILGPQAFQLKAQKRGVLMPLLVNLFGVFLLLAGGGVLWYFFQRGETTLKSEVVAVASAEGRLIQELKREAEERLLAKNREISDIQGRLSEIDRERQDLAANLEAKVQAREQELRQGMEAALAEERERLRRQGVSEEVINRRLAALEASKNDEFQRELSAFKRQAEEEKARAESSLQALQQEYQANLAKVNEERQKVLEESKQREAELQQQLAARSEALEAESQQARRELARIAEQREKERLAAGQLVGFYSRVKEDLRAGRLEPALAGLESVRQYLNDPAIAALPAIQQRREVELFVADSLSSLVKSEQAKSQADTSSLLAAADLVTSLRQSVQEGDALLSRGEAAEAEKKYNQALALVPEVDRTHRYFLAKLERGIGPAEEARRSELRAALARAQAAFDARDFAGAAEAYSGALRYLPEEPAEVERLSANLRQAGYELGAERQKRQETSAAAGPLADADRLSTLGRYPEAIAAYTALIDRYPASAQVKPALQGIGRAVEALGSRPAVGDAAPGDAQVRALQQELAARTEEAARLRKDLQDKAFLAESLQREKQMLSEEIASLKEQVRSLSTSGQESAAAAAELNAETQAKLARLQAIEASYNRIVESYQKYAAQEDALVSGKGEPGLVEAKLHLNAFLTSTEETFPGLWNRIKRYDGAFEKAGRTSALEDVSDVLYELSLRSQPQERQKYLDAEIARRRGDPLLAGLLKELRGLQGAQEGARLQEVNAILSETALRRKADARQQYLESEMVKNRGNAELFQFLERLLGLLRPAP